MVAVAETGAGNATTAVAVTNTAAITVDVPANVAVGDLLVAVTTFQNANVSPVVTAESGWAHISVVSPGNPRRGLSAHAYPVTDSTVLAALDPDYTFTANTNTGRAAGVMFRVTGADLADYASGASNWATSGTGPLTIPSFTSGDADPLLLLADYSLTSSGVTIVYPSTADFTQVAQAVCSLGAGTPPGTTVLTVQQAQGSGTSQPDRTVTYTGASTVASGWQIAIKALPEPPSGPQAYVLRTVEDFDWVEPATADTLYASTPTTSVALGTGTTISGATLVPPDDAVFTYRGAGDMAFGTAGGTTAYYAPESRYPYTWASPGSFGVEFIHTGEEFEIRFRHNADETTKVRLTVDGQWVTELAQATGATNEGSGHTYKVDFGSSDTRRILIELVNMPFGGVYVAPGDSIEAIPAYTKTLACLGDSITGGSDVNTGGGLGTWLQRFGRYAGFEDVWNLAIGGTGYVEDGTSVIFEDRVADVVTANPDVLIIWGGVNDGAVDLATPAASLIDDIRAVLPDVRIVLFGMYEPDETAGAGSITRDGELQTAASAKGVSFVSFISGNVYRAGSLIANIGPLLADAGETAAYVGDGVVDFIHPTDAGHEHLANYVYEALTSSAEIPANVFVLVGGVEVAATIEVLPS